MKIYENGNYVYIIIDGIMHRALKTKVEILPTLDEKHEYTIHGFKDISPKDSFSMHHFTKEDGSAFADQEEFEDYTANFSSPSLGAKIEKYADATLPLLDTDISIFNRAGIWVKTTFLNIKNNIINTILARNNVFTGNNTFEKNVVVKGESSLTGNALEVVNSNNVKIIQVLNTGQLRVGSPINAEFTNGTHTQINRIITNGIFGTDTASGLSIVNLQNILRSFQVGNNTNVAEINSWHPLFSNDIRNGLRFRDTLTASSGTAQYRAILIDITLNQTGTATGITRGIYINPIVTGVSDFRAIESTFGGAYFNTTNVQISAILQADSTTKGFLPPRMTTAQRDLISTPANGLIIYNTTTNKHQGYNGTWNDFY